MADKQNECLTAPEILIYLDGGLPEDRKVEIDAHLDDCRLCEAAVEGVAGLEWREGFLSSTERALMRVRARTATAVTAASAPRRLAPRYRPAPQYLTLAATLVLGLGAAVYFTRPGPGEALFQRYFEPYPSTQPVVRGGAADGRSNALALYEAHDYRGALVAFEASLEQEPNDPMARFYAGLSRLALGQAREATVDLEQYAAVSRLPSNQLPETLRQLEEVRRLGGSELQEPAEWYLALAHLRSHDLEEARSRLEHIAQAGGFYKEKARALLLDLDGSDRAN